KLSAPAIARRVCLISDPLGPTAALSALLMRLLMAPLKLKVADNLFIGSRAWLPENDNVAVKARKKALPAANAAEKLRLPLSARAVRFVTLPVHDRVALMPWPMPRAHDPVKLAVPARALPVSLDITPDELSVPVRLFTACFATAPVKLRPPLRAREVRFNTLPKRLAWPS